MRGFRVWSDYWKRYSFDAELYSDGSLYAMFEDDDGVTHHENTDIVLEFDTGLKDKNGKEIYMGDIVDDGYSRVCKIRWSGKYAGFKAVNENDGYGTNIWFVSKYGEVIGNIHENPELLGEEE